MMVVANASPIIFLSKLDGLWLLPECFGTVAIPEAVLQELGGLPLMPAIQIRKVSALSAQFVAGALGRLHLGELEAMILAREIQADYVLLDDLLARKRAQRMGVPVMGTIGVIVLAHRRERIDQTTALNWLDELVHRHGLYVSEEMLNRVKATIAR